MRVATTALVMCVGAGAPGRALGHGQLNYPPSTRQGLPGTIWPGAFSIGGYCEQPHSENPHNPLNGPCMMFSQPSETQPNVSVIPGPPRNNAPRYRTHNRNVSSGPDDWTAKMPWRWPGSANVLESGCGVAGGGDTWNENGGWPPTGMTQGYDAALLPAADNPTEWAAGETVEVAFGVWANHGGGYSYRLCPKSEEISEECFQRTPLKFASEDGGKQWLQHLNGTRVAIEMVKLTENTYPEGSEWARLPFPGCATGGNPPGHGFYDQCTETLFPEPLPGLHGFGYTNDSSVGCAFHDWSVVDQVVLPADLAAGDYLLSWRWDCEQTTQIWQNAADVRIRSATATATATADPVAGGEGTTHHRGGAGTKLLPSGSGKRQRQHQRQHHRTAQ